jgi:urease accessory protein
MVATHPLPAAMDAAMETVVAAGWQAELALRFARVDRKTVLAARRQGPLMVQKPLYPRGDEVCQVPSVSAGRDRRRDRPPSTSTSARPAAQVYAGRGPAGRSAGSTAAATTCCVSRGGVLSGCRRRRRLPARAPRSRSTLEPAADATLGWDIVVLGRPEAGETFPARRLAATGHGGRGGEFTRKAALEGVCVSFRAILGGVPGLARLARRPRSPPPYSRVAAPQAADGVGGVTQLPGPLARYAGGSAQSARTYLLRWRILRRRRSTRGRPLHLDYLTTRGTP